MSIFKFNRKHCIQYQLLCLHFNHIVFCHASTSIISIPDASRHRDNNYKLDYLSITFVADFASVKNALFQIVNTFDI